MQITQRLHHFHKTSDHSGCIVICSAVSVNDGRTIAFSSHFNIPEAVIVDCFRRI